jgi:hypothetical protein
MACTEYAIVIDRNNMIVFFIFMKPLLLNKTNFLAKKIERQNRVKVG